MRLSKTFFKRFIVVVVLFSVTTFLLATYVLPYAILQPKRLVLDIAPASVSENFSPVSIAISENDSIRGYLFEPSKQATKGTLILVHGIGGAKEHFFPLAAKLNQDGYNALVMDNRAHGNSDGLYTTYGYKEKRDISLLVDYLLQKHPDLKVGIWGSSMGGAIALQAMEQDKRIQFGIVESTFTDLPQITYDYQKRFSAGIGLRFLSDYVLAQAGVIAGFDPKSVSPLKAVKNIQQPVFLAHGDQDQRITYKYSEMLFNNLSSKDKSFELIKGAGHLDLGEIGGEEYYTTVQSFIERQLNE